MRNMNPSIKVETTAPSVRAAVGGTTWNAEFAKQILQRARYGEGVGRLTVVLPHFKGEMTCPRIFGATNASGFWRNATELRKRLRSMKRMRGWHCSETWAITFGSSSACAATQAMQSKQEPHAFKADRIFTVGSDPLQWIRMANEGRTVNEQGCFASGSDGLVEPALVMVCRVNGARQFTLGRSFQYPTRLQCLARYRCESLHVESAWRPRYRYACPREVCSHERICARSRASALDESDYAAQHLRSESEPVQKWTSTTHEVRATLRAT